MRFMDVVFTRFQNTSEAHDIEKLSVEEQRYSAYTEKSLDEIQG